MLNVVKDVRLVIFILFVIEDICLFVENLIEEDIIFLEMFGEYFSVDILNGGDVLFFELFV